ncbi:hypothetical protein SISSUDRAFT_1066806 [Sistotremastrum suecicum HHB10207 ss-3]|uniref:Uncharacterized protein n=1 Tax=Sistotremastrum suecicum HHB10207 ss-3 TaxID=1314776 RepID=A0A165XVP3_9AGAM|nr:hypothetical protein SISSUDRAFT_1066806 [Sistotremastrum suecicum HHB10207 ss-3]
MFFVGALSDLPVATVPTIPLHPSSSPVDSAAECLSNYGQTMMRPGSALTVNEYPEDLDVLS